MILLSCTGCIFALTTEINATKIQMEMKQTFWPSFHSSKKRRGEERREEKTYSIKRKGHKSLLPCFFQAVNTVHLSERENKWPLKEFCSLTADGGYFCRVLPHFMGGFIPISSFDSLQVCREPQMKKKFLVSLKEALSFINLTETTTWGKKNKKLGSGHVSTVMLSSRQCFGFFI